MLTGGKTRRHFIEAAREAAALARQRKREHRAQFPDEDQLAMLVTRAADGSKGFVWEIRRFGRMEPVAQSTGVFPDSAEAERSGRATLDDMRATAR